MASKIVTRSIVKHRKTLHTLKQCLAVLTVFIFKQVYIEISHEIYIVIMITEILEGIRIVKKLVCIIMLSVNNATDIFLVIW